MYPFLSSNIFVLLFLASLGTSKPENFTINDADVDICEDRGCVKYFPDQWASLDLPVPSGDTHANRSSDKATFHRSPPGNDSGPPPSMSLEFNGRQTAWDLSLTLPIAAILLQVLQSMRSSLSMKRVAVITLLSIWTEKTFSI